MYVIFQSRGADASPIMRVTNKDLEVNMHGKYIAIRVRIQRCGTSLDQRPSQQYVNESACFSTFANEIRLRGNSTVVPLTSLSNSKTHKRSQIQSDTKSGHVTADTLIQNADKKNSHQSHNKVNSRIATFPHTRFQERLYKQPNANIRGISV